MGTILIQTITVPKLLSLVMDRCNSDFCKAFNKWRVNAITTKKTFFVHSRLLGIVELQNEKNTEEEQCQRRQMVCLKLRHVSKTQCCKVGVVSGGPFLF